MVPIRVPSFMTRRRHWLLLLLLLLLLLSLAQRRVDAVGRGLKEGPVRSLDASMCLGYARLAVKCHSLGFDGSVWAGDRCLCERLFVNGGEDS